MFLSLSPRKAGNLILIFPETEFDIHINLCDTLLNKTVLKKAK